MSFLRDLVVRIRGDKSQLESTLQGAGASVSTFGNIVKKIGGFLVAAFALNKIVDFGKEVTKLGLEAQAAEQAFKNLGNPAILSGLEKATRGMIMKDDLMAMAVKASNLGISLIDLAKYMKFATDRAIQMNKPVAEFIDLMLNGIGRQSTRALVQMGVSAAEMKAIVKDSGGFIAGFDKYMIGASQKMGTILDTSATKIAQMTKSWKEVKEGIGTAIIETKLFQGALSQLSQMLDDINNNKKTPSEKGEARAGDFMSSLSGKDSKTQISEMTKEAKAYGNILAQTIIRMTELSEDGITVKKEDVKEYDNLVIKAKEYESGLNSLMLAIQGSNKAHVDELETLDEKKKRLGEIKDLLAELKDIEGQTLKGYKLDTIKGKERGPTSLANFLPITNAPGLVPMQSHKMAFDPSAVDSLTDKIKEMTQGLLDTQDATNMLANSFDNLFQKGGGGIKGMVNSIISDLERLVAQILAKKVIEMLLNLFSSITNKTGPSIINGIDTGVPGSSSTLLGGAHLSSAGHLNGEFKLRGQDLYLSVQRAGNSLNANT